MDIRTLLHRRSGLNIRVAIFLLAGGLAAIGLMRLAYSSVSRPVVGQRELGHALARSGLGTPFEADGIRFLEARLAEKGSENGFARSRLARLYLARFKATGKPSDLDAATAQFHSVLREDSSQSGAYSGLSSCSLAGHRFQDALAYARKSVSLADEAEKDPARLILFDALFATGNYAEAESRLDSAAKAGPSSGVLTRRARLLAWKGALAGARAALDSGYADALAGSASPPVQAWYLCEKAGLDDRAGEPSHALDAYLEALDRSPGYPPALEGIARLAYAWDGNLPAADRLMDRAYANGGHLTLLLDRAALQKEMGRTDKADSLKAAYLTAATADTSDLRLNYRPLAFLLSEQGSRLGNALDYAELDLRERNTQEGLDCLSWVYYKRGSLAVAYHYSLLAMKGQSRDPGLLCHAALIAWHAGKKEDAAAILEKALDGNGARFAWKKKSAFPGKGLPENGTLEGMPVTSARASELLAFHSHGP